MFLARGLTRAEFATVLSIVMPMLATVSGLAVAYVIRSKKKLKGRIKSDQLSDLYVVVSITLPVLFAILIGAMIVMKAFNFWIASIEDLKVSLAAIETIFGAYTGKIIASLFQQGEPS